MGLPYRKVVLLEGDPYLTHQILLKIKQNWFPESPTSAEWIEIEPPSTEKGDVDYCKSIAEELAMPNIGGGKKVVLLCGIADRKKPREGILRILPHIPEPNTLIILDTNETMRGEDWSGFRNDIKGHGEVVSTPLPLNAKDKNGKNDIFSESERIHYVMQHFQSKGYHIDAAVATMILGMLGADRGLIESEASKLMILSEDKVITESLVSSCVMPLDTSYQSWCFEAAFNTGNYESIMSCASRLLLKDDFNYERIMLLAMKQTRWQLIAAESLLRGQDMKSVLRKMSTPRSEESAQNNIWPRMGFKLRKTCMAKFSADKEKKKKASQEVIFSEPALRNIVDFVQNHLLRNCPSTTANSHAWAYRKAIDRYLIAHNALVRLRECKDNSSSIIFAQTMRTLSF